MDDTSIAYIPFDFGVWTSATGLRCPAHGLQYGGPAFEVTEKGRLPVRRQYCGLCLLKMFDAAVLHPTA